MCKLAGINFGYADAEKELSEMPDLFDSAFIDPKNYLKELLNGRKFLILGRKGSGKTAYGAKIRRLSSDKNNHIIAKLCSLSDLNYSSFQSEFADPNVFGGRKFLGIWKYLIMLEVIRLIFDKCPEQENQELSELYDGLKKYGLLSSGDLVHTASELKTSELKINLKNIFQFSYGNKKEKVVNGPSEISEIMLDTVCNCFFGENKSFIIVDGLDDVLRSFTFSSDIITGLLRAAENLNSKFKSSLVNIKIIILLRTDIFNLCRDPDLNKIKRDSSINLSWSKDDLKEIVIRRIQNVHPYIKNFNSFWYDYVPEKYKEKDSIQYLFELTLMRPRDILQFFIECQNLYEQRNSLSYKEFASTISAYSKNYFVSEMQDDLTGFLDDSVVKNIPSLFSGLGKRIFYEDEMSEIIEQNDLKITAKQLLKSMFESGYIGQVRDKPYGGRYSFRYLNPYDNYMSRDQCIVHRGLVKAFNIL